MAIAKTIPRNVAKLARTRARLVIARAARRISELSYFPGTEPLIRVDTEALMTAVGRRADELEQLVRTAQVMAGAQSPRAAREIQRHLRSGELQLGPRGQIEINAERLAGQELLSQTGHALMADGTVSKSYPMGLALTTLAEAGVSVGLDPAIMRSVAQQTLENFQGRFVSKLAQEETVTAGKKLTTKEISQHMADVLERITADASAVAERLRRIP